MTYFLEKGMKKTILCISSIDQESVECRCHGALVHESCRSFSGKCKIKEGVWCLNAHSCEDNYHKSPNHEVGSKDKTISLQWERFLMPLIVCVKIGSIPTVAIFNGHCSSVCSAPKLKKHK